MRIWLFALRAASSFIWGDGGWLFHFILSKISFISVQHLTCFCCAHYQTEHSKEIEVNIDKMNHTVQHYC